MINDNTYNKEFYETLNKSSEVAAELYIDYLYQYIQPNSVIDVGCGYASWLKACEKFGSKNLTGVDGIWNDGKAIIDRGYKFLCADLDELVEIDQKYDLAISLEVAEHLQPESSEKFVKCLTSSSDLILFSAAFTNQGGTNHINERNPSYWAKLFEKQGYGVFDLFREKFWGDNRIGFWYRQNCFLYCKKSSMYYEKLISKEVRVIENTEFLDCIHPTLYMTKCGEGIGFASHAKGIIPSFFKAIKRILLTK